MRTFLAWTLRVTISPVNSFEPVFLKVPMVAIVSLRFPFPSPHHAVSMAIGRPEAIDGSPLARGPRRACALGWGWGWTAKELSLIHI